MAEGIARERYSHLATFAGAGTMAERGSAPTDLATAAAAELGVDITRLRGTELRHSLDPVPDRIYVMAAAHHSQVVDEAPNLADRVELLDPTGEIADPYGRDLAFYRVTRDTIAAAIDARSLEWADAMPP